MIGDEAVPAFLETEPGNFKPIEERSRLEIQAAMYSLAIQAEKLVDEANALGHWLDSNTRRPRLKLVNPTPFLTEET